jgi:hypothetical protein
MPPIEPGSSNASGARSLEFFFDEVPTLEFGLGHAARGDEVAAVGLRLYGCVAEGRMVITGPNRIALLAWVIQSEDRAASA